MKWVDSRITERNSSGLIWLFLLASVSILKIFNKPETNKLINHIAGLRIIMSGLIIQLAAIAILSG